MASFFDLKARKQAAANGELSGKQGKQAKETPRAQPWVEK
jgi:replication factor C subunit 2/4